MNETRYVHHLGGCSPTPIAHYLKALGILRLVCEQADATARGAWRDDHFVLHTALDSTALEHFFLEDYAPTPVVTPWNGGSGFYAKDNKTGIDFLVSSSSKRFEAYRDTITRARAVLASLNLTEKPDAKRDKPLVLEACRGRFSDVALDWLDAAFVLGESDPRYPPLLGTGGNEGHLEFANNLMQRLGELFDTMGSPSATAPSWLAAALWGRAIAGLRAVSVGQFQPGSAGGANAAAGFEGPASVNPWDFVLMIEGALMLGATAVRRFDGGGARGRAAFPFTVGATSAGYGSADATDEGDSRGELWLPVWHEPTGSRQLRALMGEGRADVGARRARTGLDFARAVSSLGVDRGIDSFERYGFHVRNGLSYFATCLGRFQVGESKHVGLLTQLDPWLSRYRGKCAGGTAPASITRALRRFEQQAMLMASRDDADTIRETFLALGELQAALSASLSFCQKSFISPLPLLSRDWLGAASAGNRAEVRLAIALASVEDRYGKAELPIRSQVEPVERRGSFWNFTRDSSGVDWRPGSLPLAMGAILQRRLVLASTSGSPHYADKGNVPAALGDLDAFIHGDLDDALLIRWFRACLLLERIEQPIRTASGPRDPLPYTAYSLLKLALPPGPLHKQKIPITPSILRLALAGRADAAVRAAARRLRASGLLPTTDEAHASPERMRRCAAALLFPISEQDTQRLAGRFLRPDPSLRPELNSQGIQPS